jgi:hypothetical protein
MNPLIMVPMTWVDHLMSFLQTEPSENKFSVYKML